MWARAVFRFEVPQRACGSRCTNVKSAALGLSEGIMRRRENRDRDPGKSYWIKV